jgi:predicted methyltransferase
MGSNGKPCASLYGWRHFFPNSKVFGADIDKDILITFPNIKTYYCDQTNPKIIKHMWDEPLLNENFDIIIEDGLHTFEANVCFFENSIHKLNENGYYIIEDIHDSNINLFYDKIKKWEIVYPNLTFNFVLNAYMNRDDNNLLVIHYEI